MGLDARGDISVALLVIYVPIVFLSLFLALRYGFGRDAGWITILIFALGEFSPSSIDTFPVLIMSLQSE